MSTFMLVKVFYSNKCFSYQNRIMIEYSFITLFLFFCHYRISDENCSLIEILEAVRPHLQLTFDNILAHINTIYVLSTRKGVSCGNHERNVRLKGQMMYIPDADLILFQCYPSVMNLNDLTK